MLCSGSLFLISGINVSSFTIKFHASCSFVEMFLIRRRRFCSVSSGLNVCFFVMNASVLNFVEGFSCLHDHTVFLLYFGNLVDCVDLVFNAKPSLGS